MTTTAELRALPDGSLSREEVSKIADRLDDLDNILNWYNTTHGEVGGHDHHCDMFRLSTARPARHDGECNCGWTGAEKAFARHE